MGALSIQGCDQIQVAIGLRLCFACILLPFVILGVVPWTSPAASRLVSWLTSSLALSPTPTPHLTLSLWVSSFLT